MQLTVEKLSKRYGRAAQALRDVDLRLEPGVLGLLGPNGAGKSTLMRILATVTRASSGRVLWNDEDIARNPDVLRDVLGYLPQDFGVYPNLNALEFLEYLAAVKGIAASAARKRIGELLELVNLSDAAKRPLGGYSGGMRQRVGIAQALLNDPQLLIVDEPTAGLDPEERVRFRNLLSELSGERIVILSTHIVSDVEAVATSIAILAHGQLLAHRRARSAAGFGCGESVGSGDCERGIAGAATETPGEQHGAPQRRHSRARGGGCRAKSRGASAGTVARGRLPCGVDPATKRGQRSGRVKQLRAISAIARADFLERVRRYSFLLTLLFAVFLGYAAATGRIALQLGEYRGIYTSAWIGALIAMTTTCFVSLVGFYIVKSAIDRDRQTGVGQILAATPLSKAAYTLGQIPQQLCGACFHGRDPGDCRGPDADIRAAKIRTSMASRCWPPSFWSHCRDGPYGGARGVVRNSSGSARRHRQRRVVFRLVHPGNRTAGDQRQSPLDPMGLMVVADSMMAGAHANIPGYKDSFSFTIADSPVKIVQSFRWQGVAWTWEDILLRILWIGAAVAMVFLAALVFDRFDSSRWVLSSPRRAKQAPAASGGVASPASAETPRVDTRELALPRI